MEKGSTKVAWSARATIITVLIAGIFLDVAAGLDVFSYAPLAIPLITGRRSL